MTPYCDYQAEQGALIRSRLMGAKSGHLTVPHSIPPSMDLPLAAKALRLPWQIYLWWRKELSIWRAIRELEGLNDHSLKDIGLNRGSIEYEVRNAQPK